MVINHQHKFIFIHATKTGGTTLKRFLQKNSINNTLNTITPEFLLKNFSFKARSLQINGYLHTVGHLPIIFAKEYFAKEYEKYYKFGFIRNPYDRFVSSFFYLMRQTKKPLENMNYAEIALYFKDRFIPYATKVYNKSVWLVPQHVFLCDTNGKNLMDYIGNTKTLQENTKNILQKLNIKNINYDHFKKANTSTNYGVDRALLLDAENKQRIYQIYKRDFEIFNFSKE
jgi:hypothetical protein